MLLAPYLNFDGKCKEAFAFYAKALDGKVTSAFTYGESPMAKDMPPETHDRVMHSQLEFGDSVLMGADGPPRKNAGDHVFSLNLMPTDPAEAERLFAALSEGGKVTMPIEETFWAHRFGALVDRYGMPWMVNCLKPIDGSA